MSLSKKGGRKITVGEITYLWKAKGNFEVINLTIVPLPKGQKILSSFDYNTEHRDSSWIVYPFVISTGKAQKTRIF